MIQFNTLCNSVRALVLLAFASSLHPAALGQIIPDPVRKPESLKGVKVPEPSNLNYFIRDKKAAILLGKALFWDMQVGSDGRTACATCHFHAGADNRSKNQISPGLLRVRADLTLDPDITFQIGGPNYTLRTNDFPFHKLANVNDRKSTVLSTVNDVVSSAGVSSAAFVGIDPYNLEETVKVTFDNIFNVRGVNTRRVEPRNTPTVINAVFNLRNFWDGRAQDRFNGINPFGLRDTNAYVWKASWNGATRKYDLTRVAISLDMASLASLAVGPPLSSFEMSAKGRLFPELGRKLLYRRPLSTQQVHREDGVLGNISRSPNPGLTTTTYAALIKNAFREEWWQGIANLPSRTLTVADESSDTMGNDALSDALDSESDRIPMPTEFTQMESNFSLYFGLAIQLYEATLVSGQSPLDSYAEGNSQALTPLQKQGLDLFYGRAKCANCHTGAEFTTASVSHTKTNRLERMIMGNSESAVYDVGFYNIGVRPTLNDLGVGDKDPFGRPLAESRLARDFGAGVFKAVVGVSPNLSVTPSERTAVAGAFKTPGLRNVELTAPYFHNGGKRTLREVVDFYNRGGDFREANINNVDPDIENLGLTNSEKDSLVAFLKSLTDERVRYHRAPFDHPQIFIPNGHTGDQYSVINDGTGAATDQYVELPAAGRNGIKPPKNFLE